MTPDAKWQQFLLLSGNGRREEVRHSLQCVSLLVGTTSLSQCNQVSKFKYLPWSDVMYVALR